MNAGRAAIHPAAAIGFGRSAAAYERGRPGYPDAAVDRLVAALPGRRVVDLAAGTGKLTRALVARGCDVVAVEPVAEMRALIEPPARAVDGVAEATGLPEASADAVTVAQAFHWFDGPRALREIHRVLRPGGVLALIWNRRDTTDELQRRLTALLEPLRGGAPAHRDDAWRAAIEASPLFGPLREETFVNEQAVDADGLADRIGSISFVAAMGEGERASLLAELRALAGGGTVTLRYVVELQLAARRAASG
ncbi:MAG TPA: methyltransferase domain-containing protein [Solirubrobacteraceae bacterium]|nr:methyltransferase domain-containing protein [Solirubrobacteraceae bacterium]